MPSICLTLHIHLPCHLKHYSFFDIGESTEYGDDVKTFEILNQAVTEYLIPANRILFKRLKEYGSDFRIALSISGSTLDQFERFRPDILESFQQLAGTGCVEFVSGPHYHSLASSFSLQEFREQIVIHRDRLHALFGQVPTAFRNTGLIYSDTIASEVESLGFQVILAGGAEKLLGKRDASHVYRPISCSTLKLLVNNSTLAHGLSSWKDWKQSKAKLLPLFIDFPFAPDRSIDKTAFLQFLDHLPEALLVNNGFQFQTPTQVAQAHNTNIRLSCPDCISDKTPVNDLSSWLGNEMQKDAFSALYLIESKVKGHHDSSFLRIWRMLQTSDHYCNMDTRLEPDGGGAPAVNSNGSPYDAYINFMNVLTDFSERVEA